IEDPLYCWLTTPRGEYPPNNETRATEILCSTVAKEPRSSAEPTSRERLSLRRSVSEGRRLRAISVTNALAVHKRVGEIRTRQIVGPGEPQRRARGILAEETRLV